MANNRATAYHNLSIMLDAGLPTLRALDTAVAGLRGHLPRVFSRLSQAVSKGEPLAQTMAKYPSTFAPLDVTIIDAAETSGSLPEAFKLLSDWYTFTDRMKRRMLSGLMLPLVVLSIAAFVSPGPDFLLGKITSVQYLGSVVKTLAIFFVPAMLVFIGMSLTKQQGLFRTIFDYAILRVPMFGRVIYKLAISRFCRAFYMLYKAGVPIIQSVDKAALVSGNAKIRSMLRGGVDSAKAGDQVSIGFSKKLPPEFIQIWQIGEESGSLDNCSKRLADIYADSAEMMLTELANWLPKIAYFLVILMIVYQIIMMASRIQSSIGSF